MIDISIIIPTYNRLWSLPKAIESCFDTSLIVEVIVVDDGSTDGTWEWLCRQENVVAIRQDNRGKDWAVNKGFSIAKGKYIRFLDSDDWLLPNSSHQLFLEAEKSGLDITCAGYCIFNEDETFLKEISWTVCDDFLAQQLGECDSSHYSAYLFRKEFIDDIPHRQEYAALDDRNFIIEAAMKIPRTGHIVSPTLAHRVHSKARLQNTSGLEETVNHLARLNIYKKCLSALDKNGLLTQRRKNAACHNLWYLAHWIAKKYFREAVEIVNWIYVLNPDFKIPETGVLGLMYKQLGFKTTEQILHIRRRLKHG